jgi:uncharacterized protein (DUF1697 family)
LIKYVAFLRAINVSGRNIKMPELAEHFRSLGYEHVETFITTGNVIFQSAVTSSSELAAAIAVEIEPLLGFKSEVFVRSIDELRGIAAEAATFLPKVPTNGELNIGLLSADLTAVQEAALLALCGTTDELVAMGQSIYWVCQTAQNKSKISNGVIEQKLKMRTTLRRSTVFDGLLAEYGAE